MVSETMLGISDGFSRRMRFWSGFWCSAKTEPEIEFRVVSLPPTISRIRFPRYSMRSMFRVASPWASIEIRSGCGGAFTRSFHRFMK